MPSSVNHRFREVVAAGAEAWPDLAVDPEAFAAHLEAAAPAGAEPRALVAADLHLAFACLRGDPRALAVLERDHVEPLGRVVARTGASAAQIEEVKQAVRTLLLVGPRPRLAGYGGRGDLRGWLRVIAVREAVRLVRRDAGRELTFDDALGVDLSGDPELDQLKDAYRDQFRAAFRDAVAGMSARDRGLLRHRFVEGHNVDEIGARYAVHRATAARWLARAQRALQAAIRAALRERLAVDRSQLDSILRLIDSRLELTLERL